MKSVVVAFSQEKALVGAFSVIVQLDVSTILDDLLTDGWVTARRLHAPRPDVGGLPDPALAAPRVLRPLLHHQGGVLGDKAYSYSMNMNMNMYRAVAVYGDELLCVDPVAAEARVHALLALLGQRVVSAAHQRLPAPIRDEHEVT